MRRMVDRRCLVVLNGFHMPCGSGVPVGDPGCGGGIGRQGLEVIRQRAESWVFLPQLVAQGLTTPFSGRPAMPYITRLEFHTRDGFDDRPGGACRAGVKTSAISWGMSATSPNVLRMVPVSP